MYDTVLILIQEPEPFNKSYALFFFFLSKMYITFRMRETLERERVSETKLKGRPKSKPGLEKQGQGGHMNKPRS